MVRVTINGNPIEAHENRTVLEVCRQNGIDIPTLCFHPALEPYGACRLCVVEVAQEGRPPRLVAACVTPCEEGMIIQTQTDIVQSSRQMTVELLMAQAADNPVIKSLAAEMGVAGVRFRLPEQDDCILCALCVRACREIVGVSAISMIERGIAKKVSPPFRVDASACIGCGTCVLICPTGAIKLSDVSGRRTVHEMPSDYEQVYCQVCADSDLTPGLVPENDPVLAKG